MSRGPAYLTNPGDATPGHPQRAWNGKWSVGDQATMGFVQRIVLPLIERGYIPLSTFGIQGDIKTMDRSSVAGSIQAALDTEWKKNGGKLGIRKAADEAYLGKGPGAMATKKLEEAIMSFQDDNGIASDHTVSGYTSHIPQGKVGGRTLFALSADPHPADAQAVKKLQDDTELRTQLAVDADPTTAANLAQIKFSYDWIPAKVATALAYDGHTVTDPFTQAIAKASINSRANPWWNDHPEVQQKLDAGQPVSYADLNPNADKYLHANPDEQRQMNLAGHGPILASAVPATSVAHEASGVVGDVIGGAKAALRWGDAALSYPYQLGMGTVRSAVSEFSGSDTIAPSPGDQTTLEQAIGGKSMGSGLFAEGDAAKAQAQASNDAYSVNGHALTLGRGLASLTDSAFSSVGVHVVEPGSVGYQVLSGAVDFASAYYLDPASKVLSLAGEAHKASQAITGVERGKNLERSGLIPAVRRTFLPSTALQHVASPQGQRFVDWATKSDNFDQILDRVGDVPTALALKNSTDAETTTGILHDVLGTTVRNKVYAPHEGLPRLMHPSEWMGYESRPSVNFRILGIKPDQLIDVNDPNQAVQQVQRVLLNANAEKTIKIGDQVMPATEAMAVAAGQGRNAMLKVAEGVAGNVSKALQKHGVPEDISNEMTRFFLDDTERARGFLAGDITKHADPGWAMLDGNSQPLATPFATVDLLQSSISLPDARGIKQLTGVLSPFYQNKNLTTTLGALTGGVVAGASAYNQTGSIEDAILLGTFGAAAGAGMGHWRGAVTRSRPYGSLFPVALLDNAYNKAFKPLALLRSATMLRIVSEAQLAIAADGGMSMANHPITTLGLILGGRTPYAKGAARFPERMAGGLLEDSFAGSALDAAMKGNDPVAFQKAMTGTVAGLVNDASSSRRFAGKIAIEPFKHEGDTAVQPAFIQAWADRLFHYSADPVWRYAASHDQAETVAWLQNGEGRQYLDYLRGSTTRAPGEIPSKPNGFDLNTPEDTKTYVDETYKQMNLLTGGDADTAHILQQGNHVMGADGPVPLFEIKDRKMRLTKEGRAHLTQKAEEGSAPKSVFTNSTEAAASKSSAYDDAVSHFFAALYERPSDRLAYSPFFRQHYWNRVAELAPHMSPEDAKRALARAEKQGVIPQIMEKLRTAVEGPRAERPAVDSIERVAATHKPTVEPELVNRTPGVRPIADAQGVADPDAVKRYRAWLEAQIKHPRSHTGRGGWYTSDYEQELNDLDEVVSEGLPITVEHNFNALHPQDGPIGPAQDELRTALAPFIQQRALENNHARPLSAWTGDGSHVYGERSASRALDELHGNSGNGAVSHWYATSEDMARGQGENRGVLVKYDAGSVRGHLNNGKPGWEHAYDHGDAEFRAAADFGGSEIKRAIRSVEIPNGDEAKNFHLTQTLKREGFTSAETDRGTTVWSALGTAPTERLVTSPGYVPFSTVDQLSKGHALDKTKTVLHDLSERSQFFDSMRLMFPFGEAWKQIGKRWLRLASNNPKVFRRFDQGVHEARSGGFFYTDPTSGEEVFNNPMTQGFNKLMTGVDVPMVSAVNGLNVVGNGMPGVGWAGQIPMQWIVQNSPTVSNSVVGDMYRNLVAPMGDQPGGDMIGVAINAALPPWIDRLRERFGDPTTKRQMANTIAHVEQYLMTHGGYGSPGKGLTEQQMQKLRVDATAKAQQLVSLRAIGSFGLPSAPNFQYEIVDNHGKMAMVGALANEMRKLVDQEKSGKIPSADIEFVNRHGLDAFAAMTPLTQPLSSSLPVTEKGGAWVRSHDGIRSDYPAVYGLFAPPDPKGKFDERTYEDQITRGERIAIPNDQWLLMANDRIGRFKMDMFTTAVGENPSTKAQAFLADKRRELAKQYPGYGKDYTPPALRDKNAVIDQLSRAAVDPRLARTDQAKALRKYLAFRGAVSDAYDAAHGNPDGWLVSKSGAKSRAFLHGVQTRLKAQYPKSAGVFELVFRKDGEV